MMMFMLFVLPMIGGCNVGSKKFGFQLPIRSPIVRKDIPAQQQSLKDRILNKGAISQVFAKSGGLMTILILGGVAGIVLALWARQPAGIFLTIGCWAGAALLVTLSAYAYVIGFLILIAGLIMLVLMIIRWKQIADSAIDYADGLKRHVTKDDKERVNAVAYQVQPKAVRKYVLHRRKIERPTVIKPIEPITY